MKDNPFQKILLTRPPERNSEGTRFDVWLRTDEGVKFLGTGEVVNDLPAPVDDYLDSMTRVARIRAESGKK